MKARPSTPSFLLGYWRPWNEDSDFVESYLDYTKDIGLAKYGADIVGTFIQEANQNTIKSINGLGKKVGNGLRSIEDAIDVSNTILKNINSNLKYANDLQNVTNEFLDNIGQLMRISDDEKARQRSIELGMKFFSDSRFNKELITDALEELLKAEKLMKQDYFVLHHIGLIYMKGSGTIDTQKAYDYFTNAAKYAEVESDPESVRIYNELDKSRNYNNKTIKLIAAESFSWAAFAAYVNGNFSDAVANQKKTVKYRNEPHDYFLLAKYQVRNNKVAEGVKSLSKSIEKDNIYATLVFKDLDLINEEKVRKHILKINQNIDEKINTLKGEYASIISEELNSKKGKLSNLLTEQYHKKMYGHSVYVEYLNQTNVKYTYLKEKSNNFKEIITNHVWTKKNHEVESVIKSLNIESSESIEDIEVDFKKAIKFATDNNVEIKEDYKKNILLDIQNEDWNGLQSEKKRIILQRSTNEKEIYSIEKKNERITNTIYVGFISLAITLIILAEEVTILSLVIIALAWLSDKYFKKSLSKKIIPVNNEIQSIEKRILEIDKTQKKEADKILKNHTTQTYNDNEIEKNFTSGLTQINDSIKEIDDKINTLDIHDYSQELEIEIEENNEIDYLNPEFNFDELVIVLALHYALPFLSDVSSLDTYSEEERNIEIQAYLKNDENRRKLEIIKNHPFFNQYNSKKNLELGIDWLSDSYYVQGNLRGGALDRYIQRRIEEYGSYPNYLIIDNKKEEFKSVFSEINDDFKQNFVWAIIDVFIASAPTADVPKTEFILFEFQENEDLRNICEILSIDDILFKDIILKKPV